MKLRSLTLAVLVGLSGSAMAAVTISGTDFNNAALVGSANGTYVPGSPGYMHLAYTGPNDNAVVGAKGPFGALSGLNMSFDYSNLIGNNGNGPYAAFGVSENSRWDFSAQEFLVIAMSGNQINGNTLVHVVDNNASTNYILMGAAITLNQLLGETFGGVEFGDMNVMRAYADFGAATGSGSVTGSVDINSITVGPNVVPEPESLALVGLALAGLAITRRRKV